MSQEMDKLRESSYDGIQEYDNDLPRWWLVLFFGTIIFAGGYTVYYQFGPGESPVQVLAHDMAELNAKKSALQANQPKTEMGEEQLLALTKNADALAKGKAVYDARCLPCHGPQGGGIVGPNLTDKYWIHGAKLTDNRTTVVNGVLDKGMLAWKGVISDEEINDVVAFIYTLRGTDPANPKAPQGDLVE